MATRRDINPMNVERRTITRLNWVTFCLISGFFGVCVRESISFRLAKVRITNKNNNKCVGINMHLSKMSCALFGHIIFWCFCTVSVLSPLFFLCLYIRVSFFFVRNAETPRYEMLVKTTNSNTKKKIKYHFKLTGWLERIALNWWANVQCTRHTKCAHFQLTHKYTQTYGKKDWAESEQKKTNVKFNNASFKRAQSSKVINHLRIVCIISLINMESKHSTAKYNNVWIERAKRALRKKYCTCDKLNGIYWRKSRRNQPNAGWWNGTVEVKRYKRSSGPIEHYRKCNGHTENNKNVFCWMCLKKKTATKTPNKIK